MKERAREIILGTEKLLYKDSSRNDVNLVNVQMIAERYRCEQNILTSQMLETLESVKTKNMKKLYNYNLTSLKEKNETKRLVREEYVYGKIREDGGNFK